jgi:hypothetical protein
MDTPYVETAEKTVDVPVVAWADAPWRETRIPSHTHAGEFKLSREASIVRKDGAQIRVSVIGSRQQIAATGEAPASVEARFVEGKWYFQPALTGALTAPIDAF